MAVTPYSTAFTTLTRSCNDLLLLTHYFWKSGKGFKSTLYNFSASAILKLPAVLLTCQVASSAELCYGTFDGHQKQLNFVQQGFVNDFDIKSHF